MRTPNPKTAIQKPTVQFVAETIEEKHFSALLLRFVVEKANGLETGEAYRKAMRHITDLFELELDYFLDEIERFKTVCQYWRETVIIGGNPCEVSVTWLRKDFYPTIY